MPVVGGVVVVVVVLERPGSQILKFQKFGSISIFNIFILINQRDTMIYL